MPYNDGTEGPHEGVAWANVHPLIGDLCLDGEGRIDDRRYVELTRGNLSLDDALTFREMRMVAASRRDAAQHNQAHNRES